MSRRPIWTPVLIAMVVVGALGGDAQGQTWSLDVSTGRIVYDPITAAAGTSNLAGSVRYDAPRGAWIYATGAAPVRAADPVWGGVGGGGRLLLPGSTLRRVTAGADVGADAFLFRDRLAQSTGNGGTVDALPFVRVSSGAASLEGRAGWRGYALSQAGVVDRRGAFETGGRASYRGPVFVQADMRWVHATEGTYPFLGGALSYAVARAHVWGQAGRWLTGVVDSASWGAGGGVDLGDRSTVWVSLRQEASDPLYWNARRRTWSLGLTRRLGRTPAILQPVTRTQAGVLIRLPVAEAAGNAMWVAGDFNQWQPVPMRREGNDWVLRLPLAPGVYNYGFRRADGEWFVPASVAGRRDDGFGGHVAVLVVL